MLKLLLAINMTTGNNDIY